MSVIRSLIRPREKALTIDDIGDIFRMGGYVLGGAGYGTTLNNPKEEIPADFAGLVLGLYRANPIASAAVVRRMQIFAQARFRFREINNGEPGKWFGTTDLDLLDHPEPTLSTSDMLKRALLDNDFAGNWFGVRRPQRIKRIRPDWTYIVKASRASGGEIDDVDTEVVGIVYQAGGIYSAALPEPFPVGEYAHFAAMPDPLASYRGMSWLTTIIREVQADDLMTTHKQKFLEHGATVNTLVKFPPALPQEKAQEFMEIFEQEHAGVWNAYKTVFLGGGADLTPIGSNMQQVDFKAVQGAGETRIALASGVPAVLLQISEGLQGSSLNTGNYAAAKKQFGDGVMRDLWQTMASALEDILPPRPGSELWYDEKRIPFLKEDVQDAANVLNLQATAMRTLWDGGAEPDSVIEAVTTGDMTRVKHTGQPSVQLQPGEAPPADQTPPDQQAPPAAFLSDVIEMAMGEVRCPNGHLLAEQATPPYRFTCGKCKAVVVESGRWAVTTDPKVVSYSPSQPRKPDGKFGSGASGESGGTATEQDASLRESYADWRSGLSSSESDALTRPTPSTHP